MFSRSEFVLHSQSYPGYSVRIDKGTLFSPFYCKSCKLVKVFFAEKIRGPDSFTAMRIQQMELHSPAQQGQCRKTFSEVMSEATLHPACCSSWSLHTCRELTPVCCICEP